jgi:hypothetical protein
LIYICIPAHNEQQTVGVVLWKLRQVLTEFPRDYQLLVTDDGSTDRTAEVLEPYTRVLPLTVVRTEQRLGYAASLEMLLREAVRRSEYPRRDVIIALQADFSDEPDDVVPLIKRLEAGADVAVGNKVSSTPETRTRRWSRSLARFFARGQKWPEGVVTPFDGFRAYRLYAVKRAIEDAGGRRLVRYDGWAGHAELLRAVLPHARRVDVVDVDDRPDRLQRPRREKAFAAAMQVRAMTQNAEPAGLIGVEELDRIATTTSRSRERAAVSAPATNGRAARANGSRTGERRPESRSRSGRPDAERRPDRNAGRSRSEKPAAERNAGRTRPPKQEGAKPRPAREKPPRERQRQSGQSAAAAQADPNGTPMDAVVADALMAPAFDTPAAVAGDETAATAPKKKRRRRRRSGTRDQTSTGGATEPSAESEPMAEAAGGEAQPEADAAGAAEPKRRRRGGRRGGRGRRRPRPDGAEAGVAETQPAPDAAPTHPVPDAAHVERD